MALKPLLQGESAIDDLRRILDITKIDMPPFVLVVFISTSFYQNNYISTNY